MIIGIDFSRGEMEHRTGVEWYSHNIVKHLLDLGAEHEIVLYSRRGGVSSCCRDGVNPVSMVHLRWPFRFGWTQFRLSLEMVLRPPDVLFVPSYILPPITPKRVVTMVHDVAFKRHPEWYSQKQIRVLELGIRRIIKKRVVVLVPTEFVKRELLKLYPEMCDLDIRVIPHGVDHTLFRRRSPSPLQGESAPPAGGWQRGEVVDTKVVPPSPYFLFIGRLESKKNISHIVDAFVEFVGDVPSPLQGEGRARSYVKSGDVETGFPPEADHPQGETPSLQTSLLLVGRPGHGYERFAHKLNHPNIHVIPSVSAEELVILYQNAIALVFSTLYEGFGMPILEAMACGCPVITSKGGAYEEVAGTAALLVDPHNILDIADAMIKIQSGGWKEKGLKRAHQFSWDASAQQTLALVCNKY